VAPADRAENGGILAPQGLATASLELQPVVDQSHAAAHAVLGKPNSYNQAREKSAMTISGGCTFPARDRVECKEEACWDRKRRCQPRSRRCLRLTEVPGGETHEKLRDPCSARPAKVGRRAPIVNVFNADSESSPS